MSEILKSSDLGQDPTRFGEQTDTLTIYDGLSSPFSEDVIELSGYHKEQLEAYARRAAGAFGPVNADPEPTYAQTELGVPAMVVRIDCTVIDGEIVPYEMEDSPSGQGITDVIHRRVGSQGIKAAILDHYDSRVGSIPHIVVSGARNHGTDDALIVGEDNYTFDQDGRFLVPSNKLVIVKAIPGVEESAKPYLGLQERALAPLDSEGDKTYLERIGDLTSVSGAADLLHNEAGELCSQVLKARMGSMAMGISIYLDPSDRKIHGKKGIVTASRLHGDLEDFSLSKGGALVQPFAPPIALENEQGRKNAILRVFTTLRSENGTIIAEVIGGCYVARPELIVHGAANAVGGAVVVSEENI